MAKAPRVYTKQRVVDPFFKNSIDTIFLKPEYQIFLVDGPVGLGKTANFILMGSYQIAQNVVPIKRGNRFVRESLWFCIRESENAAVATMREVIEDSLFEPEVMVDPNGPYREHGKNPKMITIQHELADGTYLKMTFECHGFNNAEAENRLRSRSALGVLIPEIQGIPWKIVEVARQRSGRWRPSTTRIKRMINGKTYYLSGIEQLKMVLADANIPNRPHKMYEQIYDHPNQGAPTVLRLPPPSPLIYKPVEDLPDQLVKSGKYPVTYFEGKKVMWFPNPKCYQMTRHFETVLVDKTTGDPILDEQGVPQTKPWSGYSLWYQELNQSDSIVRRHVLGIPDSIGGTGAIYKNFDGSALVKSRKFNRHDQVYIGYDPGKYGSYIFLQETEEGGLHAFSEIIFTPKDGLLGKAQIKQHVTPFLKSLNLTKPAIAIPDPAAMIDTSKGEGEVTVLRQEGIIVKPCVVSNQHTQARISCLGYYLEQRLFTIDPSCTTLITALKGGYQCVVLKSGMVTDTILKNEYSHPTEACQYVCVNLYRIRVAKLKRTAQGGNKQLRQGLNKIRSR